MATLVSVNVGLPRMIEWNGRGVLSAIWKAPQKGPIRARRLGLDGDGVADPVGHGGEARAVLVYQLSSYAYWNRFLNRDGFEYGQFGENLTVDGLPDDEVCIGDRYRIGKALFEVSQPRVTCFKVGIRMRHPELPGLLVAHGKPGFYMRVIQEGEICAGDEIVKVTAGDEHMTVAEIDALLYKGVHPGEKLTKALNIPALSPGWKGSFQELLKAEQEGSTSGNAGLTSKRDGVEAWKGFRPLRVVTVCQESEDVKSFVLAALDGSALPAAKPGQHIAVKFAVGPSKTSTIRFYSISGPSTGGTYRISVKREQAGSASDYLHSWATTGTVLEATAPQGRFTLEPGDGPVVLLSAGIGATPMVSMLHSLADDGADKRREVWWLHSARDGQHHSFREEVDNVLKGLPAAKSHIAYSRALDTDHVGNGFDSVGRFSMGYLQRLSLPVNADFYLCGPTEFLPAMEHSLGELGVPGSHIHTEVFGSSAAASSRPGFVARAPHPPSGVAGQGPSVTFVRSGLTVRWSEQFASLLALAEACDVPTRWSCRSGVCHSCETPVLDGHDHFIYGPEPLSPPSAGTVLICCARPQGDVQLDL
jgi:ferredoxin-NADP reductase/MOSC domain-containing protein YiiM